MKKEHAPKKKIRITPLVVILIFLILGAVGVYVEEPSKVLNQATQICLSCIGLG